MSTILTIVLYCSSVIWVYKRQLWSSSTQDPFLVCWSFWILDGQMHRAGSVVEESREPWLAGCQIEGYQFKGRTQEHLGRSS